MLCGKVMDDVDAAGPCQGTVCERKIGTRRTQNNAIDFFNTSGDFFLSRTRTLSLISNTRSRCSLLTR
jgi:hypothetical protein